MVRSGRERFGPYRLERPIGRGGHSIIYRAHHPVLRRWVALKVAATPSNEGPATETQRSLLHEARMLAGLRHPGIVTLFDAGRIGGQVFLAMELLPGPALAALSSRPAEIGRVLQLGRQIGAALAYLHGRGLVHGDLKPGNILLRSPDEPVLIDFGLCRPEASDPGRPAGTPAYMAPEQSEGRLQTASDLYALGVILYRLLTGSLPLPPGTPYELMHSHQFWLAREIELLRPEVPPRLALAVHRCLAKEPHQRLRKAAELVLELELAEMEWLAGRRRPEVPARIPPTLRGLLLVAGSAAALATIPFWSLWRLWLTELMR